MSDLPPGWEWATFADVAEIASNLVDPADHMDSPHIAPNHIESWTGRILEYSTVAEDRVTSSKNKFIAGQLLYSKIRPYLAKVASVDFSGLCSADMYPINSYINRTYLKWWMLTPAFTASVIKHQGRSVLPKINAAALRTIPIPIPPVAEQQRIVATLEGNLSRLDAGIENAVQATRRVEKLWSATLEGARSGELVGLITAPRERLIGDLAEVQGGIQKQPKRKPVNNKYPFLRVANVSRGDLILNDVHEVELFDGEIDKFRLAAGDLLVVEGNGSADQIGRAAMWHGEIADCVHQNHLIRVRPGRELNPRYLEIVWNSPTTARALRQVAGSTSGLLTLSVAKLKALSIPVPAMEEQERIVAEYDIWRGRVEHARMATDVVMRRADRLRRSILAEAFAGRLVPQDPKDEPASVLLERIRFERFAHQKSKRTRRMKTTNQETLL
ncbi:hypothetical protein D7D52_32810 [Nocardia yunnanensis]|uniref:Type I restriction modification DNA specificity domain-containing protein n=1 Tax=Nocardia yunnanensis TaxID=2382165 RepID=A0A386ZK61_9NOCA|nr:restriction endonuclease subunit S [Nocardia yunnanensis]AYF77808.1 hypothetical protein D7D52_32810 [Nocardia yunnanensis]